MSFISNYWSEYKKCKRDFSQEHHNKDIYKEDKRYKDGKRLVGSYSVYINRKRGDRELGYVIYGMSYSPSFVEGMARLNFCWKRTFIEVCYEKEFLRGLLAFLLGTIIPYMQFYAIIACTKKYRQSNATGLNKLIFTLYALFLSILTLAIYAGIIYCIILLVKRV